jgi:NAD(P)-dependent dehydrogenase (short-subunit alcohol dehydrogenase family)
LQDRVSVVTGAGGGIGRATCVALAQRGSHVAVVDIDRDAAEATAAEVERLGRRASVHLVDVRDLPAVERLAAEVEADHGACHVVVNNAGVTSAGAFEDEPVEDLHWIVDINLWGVVHGCRAFLPALRRAEDGHIVNLSSMVGLLGLPHNVSYSMTKAAVRGFSEALRAELVTTRIGLTTVFPGAINTRIIAAARGAEAQRLAGMADSRLAPLLLRPPSAVARAIVRGIERDRARVVVGPDAHLLSAASRLLPGRAGLIGRATNRLASSDPSGASSGGAAPA